MIQDQQDKYSFSLQSSSQPLKLHQPFILYNLEKKSSLGSGDIKIVDSVLIANSTNNPESIQVNLEKEGGRPRDSQHISPLTEYKLFTYLSHTKSYLDKPNVLSQLALNSKERKNTIKSELTYFNW